MINNEPDAVPSMGHRVLIVDDEKTLCDFLTEALDGRFEVHVRTTGKEALQAVRETAYDVLVLDLKLPDMSGIDILRTAKRKDRFVEALMVTGYASLETAATAVNLGASAYMVKPLSLEEFTQQIERAAATRRFHLKSLALMRHSRSISPDIADHIRDLSSLFNFSRRLLLTLEVPELIEIILGELSRRVGTLCCALGIHFLDFSELYVMPRRGSLDEHEVRELLLSQWNEAFPMMDRKHFSRGDIPLSVLKGPGRQRTDLSGAVPNAVPMMAGGATIGSLVVFSETQYDPESEENQFMYVYSSVISSIVEHAYVDIRAQMIAKTDGLTGAANRRLFFETLDREIARADRRKTSFCVAMIDVDGFKGINDTFGHPAGDTVLKDLTSRIAAMIRRGDLLARYGGEEFVLILADTNLEGAAILAERVRASIADVPCVHEGQRIRFTASLGIAEYKGTRPRGRDLVVAEADKALYTSKKNGKNRVSLAPDAP